MNIETSSPVDIQAAEHMGEMYDSLKENGYAGHELEMYLVRLLFCLFADDSGIFDERKLFFKYISERTCVDGSDLAMHLALIFEILNKPEEKRQKNMDEALQKFPYVNGDLFEKRIDIAAFNSGMRKTLLKCCTLDWSEIKPEIFGAMFQSVNDKEKRRALGEHYTSEANILKIIQPLFLDNLWEEFNKIKKLSLALRKQRLLEFHIKLQKLKFLDPACGCGNFLVVSYRELRLLEIEVLAEYLQTQQVFDIELMFRVNVDQFYGIEIEEFPARIAQTALWLMDHMMNTKASKKFGKYIVRIPLTASPSIVIGNSLHIDWESVIPKTELSFILGNPPFAGKKEQLERQKKELLHIFEKKGSKLDYVTCWYKQAAKYIQNTEIEAAFVSTNSICQGEQVSLLWPELINKHGIKINFAHQTFKWSNEAKGKAAVHCVIIGFGLKERTDKKIFIYPHVSGNPVEKRVAKINAYLISADNIFIELRSKPICNVPHIRYGNMPIDNGHLILEESEYKSLIKKEPFTKTMLRPYYGGYEFLNKKIRYCLWLDGVSPAEINKSKFVKDRIEKTREYRLSSNSVTTREMAVTPSLFGYRRKLPVSDYLLIPKVSSENRSYIPIGFMKPKIITNGSAFMIADAGLYEFGVLTSAMHMAWMRYVCGRMKSDYQYSASLVYNNFPWPSPNEKRMNAITEAALSILDTRQLFPDSTLAELYNPSTMPPKLVKAHQKLDKAVEAAYGRSFSDDSQRVSYLFELYQKLSGELFLEENRRGKGRKR